MRPKNTIARRMRSEAETNNNVKIQRSRYAALAAVAEKRSEARQKSQETSDYKNTLHLIDEESRRRRNSAHRRATNHKNPEAPPSMYELYQWFKARGELDYFFANICRDPRMLTP